MAPGYLIACIRVFIGQSFSGDGRCERTDNLPAQQLIQMSDIEDSTMKTGLVTFCLLVPLQWREPTIIRGSNVSGRLAYETFRINLPFRTGKVHEFSQNYTVVVPRKLDD